MKNESGRGIRLRLCNSAAACGSILALFGLAERVALWMTYQPIAYGDTPSYMRLAKALALFSLKRYDGTRVPGYPAFLAVLNFNPESVWLAQLIIGWIISLILFWMTWKTTEKPWLGLLVGGLYNLIPGQFLFEANLLSETLSTFLVIVSFGCLVYFTKSNNKTASGLAAFGMGIMAGLAGIVRPAFFILPVWLLPFVWFAKSNKHASRFLFTILFCIPPALILGGWLGYMYTTFHVISPDAMGGYHMIQHTGIFFEYLPDEDALIRDTYLKYRDAQIAERGVQANAIWEAIPEMSEVTGLSFYGLSRELQRLSMKLIAAHPKLYLRNVAKGWIDFWKAPVYWKPEAVKIGLMRTVLSGLAFLGRGLSVLANLLFLVISGLTLIGRNMRRKFGIDRYVLATGGFVWLISIIQAFMDHGDNPRFLMPLQMLVIYVVVLILDHLHNARRIEEAAS